MLREVMPASRWCFGILGLGAVALRLTRTPAGRGGRAGAARRRRLPADRPALRHVPFFEAYLSRRFVTSPSQSYGVMMSMPALMLILEVLRPDRRPRPATWVALALALFALSGRRRRSCRSSCAAHSAPGWSHCWSSRDGWTGRVRCSCVLLVARRPPWRSTCCSAARAAAWSFDPFATARAGRSAEGLDRSTVSTLVMVLVMFTGWLLYGVGAVGLVKAGRWRDPRAVWLALSIAAGHRCARSCCSAPV